jgi:hypothetical protein
MQAMADPEASAEPQSTEALPKPAALVSQEIATPVAPPAEYNVRRGYGFLNVSAGPEAAARLSGENVSSMFVMTKPIAAEAVAPLSGEPAAQATAVHSAEPVPFPEQKPKAKPKPIATAAAKPAAKTATAKPSEQGAPAPQDAAAAQADADGANASQAATAEAAMVESAPLTRRQKRAMRRQQQEQDPFLPWLR